jgi:hypothetical protein
LVAAIVEKYPASLWRRGFSFYKRRFSQVFQTWPKLTPRTAAYRYRLRQSIEVDYLHVVVFATHRQGDQPEA